ncbi:MAG: hypothetical protein ABH824_06875 [Nanoarchaeota archaeon]|nr:haloacid dehalogenase-like hydrolase [Nanoarchaeota archaeon]MBU1631682.1 haloacid dehalogenase-like hydrolase [Nanoarchaeota archaeon]MBU1876256.1 haloacid dehalogenase-like hydrolase [Nanoarchaeota archaeon]
MRKKAALIFDVDLTLTEEYQQMPIFRAYLEKIREKYDGKNNPKIVTEPEEYFPVLCDDTNIDIGIGSMEQLLIDVRDGTFEGLTNEKMREEFGPKVKLAEGLEIWLPSITDDAKFLDLDLSSHAISAGTKPLIEGLKIAHHFSSIRAGEYEQENGKLTRVKTIVDPYKKTDPLKEICKGEKVEKRRRLKDYEILYDCVVGFGDGQSDQRILNFIKELGGISIGVFKKGDQEDYYRCVRDLAGFVHYIVPRDYTYGNTLDNLTRKSLKLIAKRTCTFDFRLISALNQQHLRHPELIDITKKHLSECQDCYERSKPTQFYFE